MGKATLFIFLLFTSISAQTQVIQTQPSDTRDETVLDSINAHVEQLRLKIGTGQCKAQDLLIGISNAVKDIKDIKKEILLEDEQKSLTGGSVITVSPQPGVFVMQQEKEIHVTRLADEYLSSLRLDDEVLAELVNSKDNIDEMSATFSAVKSDLDVKASYLRKRGFPENRSSIKIAGNGNTVTTVERVAGSVNVFARTLRGTTEVFGFEVWFVLTLWSKRPDKFARFKSIHPPKPEPLSPGDYFMWVGRDAPRSSWVPVPIDTTASQTIDLLVPNQ